ncbi:MAG TPA: DUF6580 family putative transport protein [Patescibacteria group bacterium]|nr:DUF6580 family putative transport protein [Patescibacteria group bacterium]
MEIPKTLGSRQTTLFIVTVVLLGIGWRLVPHLPNVAPIGAIALITGSVLGWRRSLGLTLTILAITDLVIGVYPGMAWTWLGFSLIAGLGLLTRSLSTMRRIPLGAAGASLVFFLVSNFGTWVASGMYAHTVAGLIECYVRALPFYPATLLSDLAFGSLLLGLYAALESSMQTPREYNRAKIVQISHLS